MGSKKELEMKKREKATESYTWAIVGERKSTVKPPRPPRLTVCNCVALKSLDRQSSELYSNKCCIYAGFRFEDISVCFNPQANQVSPSVVLSVS